MSNQLPPLEDLPIFDSAVFTAGDQTLTYNQALKRFLRYPNAQGKETLAEIVVNGTSTFNSNALFDDAIISITDGGKFSNTLAQDSIILNNSDTGTTTTMTSENVTSTNWDIQANGAIFMGPNLYIRDISVGTTTVINKASNVTTFTSVDSALDTMKFNIDGVDILTLSKFKSTFNGDLTNTSAFWNIDNALGQGTFVNLVATGVQPPSSDSSTAVPTTNWVQGRITALLAASNFWTLQQTFSGSANIPAGANLAFTGAGGTSARISPATTPQNNLQINLRPGTTAEPLYLNNPGNVFTGTAINIGTAFGYNTGSSLFQNLTGATAPAGFTFSSMTSTVANKVVGIIPYNQPPVADDGQNLATTAWVKSVFNANPLLASNNVWTGTNTFNNTVSATTLRTNANGTIKIFDAGNVVNTTLQQTGPRLVATLANDGEILFATQGGGVLPVANNSAGTSIMWNLQGGLGESAFVNYQNGGSGVNAGGFDFYNVSSSTNSVKIATIAKVQPALTDSSVRLATTQWVKDAIAPTIASMTTTRVVSVSIPNYIYTTNLNNLYNAFQSYSISDNPGGTVINWNFINGVINSTYRIYFSITSPSSVIVNKPTGTAGNVISNLAGTTVFASGSKWVIETVYDGTTYYMNWTNYT